MASAFHNTVRFYVALFQSIAKRHSFSPILQVAFQVFKSIDNQLCILWQRAAVSFVPINQSINRICRIGAISLTSRIGGAAKGLTHLCKARYDMTKKMDFLKTFYTSRPRKGGYHPWLYSQNAPPVPLSKRPVVETSQSHNVPSQHVPPWLKRPESNRSHIKIT